MIGCMNGKGNNFALGSANPCIQECTTLHRAMQFIAVVNAIKILTYIKSKDGKA